MRLYGTVSKHFSKWLQETIFSQGPPNSNVAHCLSAKAFSKKPVPSADLSARVKYQSIMLAEEPPADEVSTAKPNMPASDNTEAVNYGYHPIIDFFQKYRFSAAS